MILQFGRWFYSLFMGPIENDRNNLILSFDTACVFGADLQYNSPKWSKAKFNGGRNCGRCGEQDWFPMDICKLPSTTNCICMFIQFFCICVTCASAYNLLLLPSTKWRRNSKAISLPGKRRMSVT